MKKIMILAGIILCNLLVFAQAQQEPHKRSEFAVGFGYPYLSLKQDILGKLAIEGRFATGKQIDVYSIRNYYNWLMLGNQNIYSGLEFGYFTFKRKNFAGEGFFQMIFTGIEFFVKPNISCSLDIGLSLITAESDFESDRIQSTGNEWVSNIGVYYYF